VRRLRHIVGALDSSRLVARPPGSVIGRPLPERSRRRAGHVLDRGCHERRPVDGGAIRAHQHVGHPPRPRREYFSAWDVRRSLFEDQPPAAGGSNRRQLFALGERLRAGQYVVASLLLSTPNARAATAAISRSRTGAVRAAPWNQRTTSPCASCGPHQLRQLSANGPGRRNVHGTPDFSIEASTPAWTDLSGFGC